MRNTFVNPQLAAMQCELQNQRMTKRSYNKYVWLLVLIVLFAWTIFTPSHFQKGGVDNDFYSIIALFITVISILIFIRYDNFHWLERILASLPFAFISLFISSLILGPMFVELFYGDKTWFLWETKHRLFINAIYYGINTAILTFFSFIYFYFRGKLKSESKTTGTIN